MNKILLSLGTIALVATIGIGGTVAYFTDTETSTGNTFTAGTLDLKVGVNSNTNLVDNPGAITALVNIAPGQILEPQTFYFKNAGSVAGKLKANITFSEIDNVDAAGDDIATNEYAAINNSAAYEATSAEMAKMLVVKSALTDKNNVDEEVSQYWATQVAGKYGTRQLALDDYAIYADGATDRPTLYGMSKIDLYYWNSASNQTSIKWNSGDTHHTTLTFMMNPTADNKYQFDGVNATVSATLLQWEDASVN
jgi:predicted ribosomally synthesized peptide with SipW-like signal peptide